MVSFAAPLSMHRWPADAAPVVTVLVTTYNHERYIGRCLSSILAQVTDFPVELIVVDDASTDRTPQIVRGFQERFPQIVRPTLLTENHFSKGLLMRPVMHRQARGEFIACCDGDDFWTDPRKLARQVAFLRGNPDCVLSFHDAVHIDAEDKPLGRRELPEAARRDYTREELRVLRWGWMLIGTMVYRNVPFEFPPEYHLTPNADNFIPMLLGAFGGAKFQADVGPLAYRQHGNSIWSSKPEAEKQRMHLQSALQITSYFVRIGELDSARQIASQRLVPRLRKNFAR